jgi:hypothetical protein
MKLHRENVIDLKRYIVVSHNNSYTCRSVKHTIVDIVEHKNGYIHLLAIGTIYKTSSIYTEYLKFIH